MILLPFNSVPRDRFFEILQQHGCVVTQLSKGRTRLHHEATHFLEVWRLSADDDFIYPDHVERIAEALGINLQEFYPDMPDMT